MIKPKVFSPFVPPPHPQAGGHSVDQTRLEVTEIHLPSPPEGWIKGVRKHVQLPAIFLDWKHRPCLLCHSRSLVLLSVLVNLDRWTSCSNLRSLNRSQNWSH